MTTQTQNAVIAFSARDEASKVMQKLGLTAKGLENNLLSMAKNMVSMSALMGAFGVSAYGAVSLLQNFVGGIMQADRTSTSLGTRMVLLGLSSDRATSAVETLRNNMSI